MISKRTVSRNASQRAASPYHPLALVESPTVGVGTRVWAFAHVLPGAVVGRDCNIGEQCYIEGQSRIGDRVTVKNGVAVWDQVTIESDVFVGPNAVFTNDLLPISRKRNRMMSTRVCQGACIGANATVVCGVTVGRYAFVGAGSVVTGNVPDYALVYGNPARRRYFLCACREKLRFKKSKAVCVCGKCYTRKQSKVQPVS